MFLYKKSISFLQTFIEFIPRHVQKITLLSVIKHDGTLVFEYILQIKLESLLLVCYLLKKHTNFLFESLVDLAAIHNPALKKSYELNYHFLSLEHNTRLQLKVIFSEGEPVESLNFLFPSANWLERECWDMFGIFFKNHPDLRRILTDYGFDLFPLRKDFPVYGYVQLRYDDQTQALLYEPITFSQEFRTYEFKSPWEQTK